MKILLATLGGILLIMTVILAMTPYLTRRTESFGVSIPSREFGNPDLAAMRRAYVGWILVTGLLFAAGILGLVLVQGENSLSWLILLFLELAVFFLIYYRFHLRMTAYKKAASWRDQVSGSLAVSLEDPDESGVRFVSPAWFLLYAIVIAATVAVSLILYPSLPDQIPMHYDLAGNVNRYAEKNLGSLLFMPGMQLFLWGVFAGVYHIIRRAKRMIDAEDAEGSAWRESAYRAAWANFCLFGGFLLVLLFAGIQLSILGLLSISGAMGLTAVFVLLILLWCILLSVKYGQGGQRLKGAKAGSRVSVRDDDRYWKAGVFYFNKEDPSLFVEKRFGVGFTSNFARPMIWAIIVGFLVVLAAVLVMAFRFG